MKMVSDNDVSEILINPHGIDQFQQGFDLMMIVILTCLSSRHGLCERIPQKATYFQRVKGGCSKYHMLFVLVHVDFLKDCALL